MATNTAAELLIRIAADPSQAEESIGQFRASFGGNLGALSTQVAQWSTQGSADFSRLQTTALQFSGGMRGDFNALEELLSRSRTSSALWRSEFVSNLESVRNSSLELQGSLVRGFLVFDSALTRNVTTAVIWQKSIGEAFTKAAVSAIGAIAQEALVRAIFSTALGFYLLAIRDFRGAANAFQSAAIFGAVGGAAALAGRALAGGVSGGSASSSNSQGSAAGQTSAAASPQTSASQAASEQKTVQVIFQGPVYGGQAGIDELVRQISRAVTDRDVNLVAYTVVRQPATRA
jgi:hypothetical protein